MSDIPQKAVDAWAHYDTTSSRFDPVRERLRQAFVSGYSAALRDEEQRHAPTHRHVLRKTRYAILSRDVRAQCSTGPILDCESVILYRDVDDGHLSVRRASEFDDGRFEKIEPIEAVDARGRAQSDRGFDPGEDA